MKCKEPIQVYWCEKSKYYIQTYNFIIKRGYLLLPLKMSQNSHKLFSFELYTLITFMTHYDKYFGASIETLYAKFQLRIAKKVCDF